MSTTPPIGSGESTKILHPSAHRKHARWVNYNPSEDSSDSDVSSVLERFGSPYTRATPSPCFDMFTRSPTLMQELINRYRDSPLLEARSLDSCKEETEDQGCSTPVSELATSKKTALYSLNILNLDEGGNPSSLSKTCMKPEEIHEPAKEL